MSATATRNNAAEYSARTKKPSERLLIAWAAAGFERFVVDLELDSAGDVGRHHAEREDAGREPSGVGDTGHASVAALGRMERGAQGAQEPEEEERADGEGGARTQDRAAVLVVEADEVGRRRILAGSGPGALQHDHPEQPE